jgi:hypothetical protein
MSRRVYFVATIVLLMTSIASAQGRSGGMRGGGQGAGQGTSAGMGGQGQGMGSSTQPGNSGMDMQQQRQQIRADSQQQQQLRNCEQTMQQVRTQMREMSRNSGQQIGYQQAARWREQLRNQMQTMTQQQEELRANLTDQQKAAVQDRLQKLQQDRDRLQQMSDSLDLALQAEELDGNQVREQSKQIDKVAKQMRTQQHELNSELGVD